MSLTQSEAFKQSGRDTDKGYLVVISSCSVLFADDGVLTSTFGVAGLLGLVLQGLEDTWVFGALLSLFSAGSSISIGFSWEVISTSLSALSSISFNL